MTLDEYLDNHDVNEGREEQHVTEWPRCPICGEECEDVYKREGEIVGCNNCIEECDAWEELRNAF